MIAKPDLKAKATAEAADERLRRDTGMEARGDRGVSEDVERITDTGLLSDDELDKFMAAEFDQTALPTPPSMPGWHLCWLTTTSPYDSLQKRQRLGYVPVRRSEMPGFDASNGQQLANFETFVTCNEMILCKLEEARYQALMRYFHHKRPLDEEEVIVSKLKAQQADHIDSAGQALVKDTGMDGIHDLESGARRPKHAPTFA